MIRREREKKNQNMKDGEEKNQLGFFLLLCANGRRRRSGYKKNAIDNIINTNQF